MAEDFDAQLLLVAVVLVVVLMAGQVVLLATHLWLPIAGVANSLLEEEPELFSSGSTCRTKVTTNLTVPTSQGVPYGSGSLGLWHFVSLAPAGFAGGRLYCLTAERMRWTWALALAAPASVWGVFSGTIIGRDIAMFEGLK